jgi:serine protease SohB
LRLLQDQVHQNFIAQVKARRGAKLVKDDSLFTGQFWVGTRAVELGLADGLGHIVPMMKDRYGDTVRFRTYGMRRPFLSRIGLSLLSDTMALAEERALYARYGV